VHGQDRSRIWARTRSRQAWTRKGWSNYKKKLLARREELTKTIARTQEEGRTADDDPTVDLADKAANSYTKEFLFGMTNTDRTVLNMIDAALKRIQADEYGVVRELPGRVAAEAAGSGAVGETLHRLPGKRWSRDCCSERPEDSKDTGLKTRHCRK